MNIHNTSPAASATSREAELYLSVAQVAARYGVSTDTIWRWTREGNFPKRFKLGPNISRWRLSDLIDHDGTLSTYLVTSVPLAAFTFDVKVKS